MEFAEWEPVYERILAAFGFDRDADERARDVLADLCETSLDPSTVDLTGTVAVCGAAPSLTGDLDRARTADRVVAASSAAAVLREADVGVDVLVTDLDGTPDLATALTNEETPVAIHAHGDNVPALRECVPACDLAWVVPTTQAAPRRPVWNFGGFTDGDRAAFLADALGADALTFPGWEFDDPTVSPTKARKLRWAARLLRWLEVRRSEQFDVLDGRRDAIDVSDFP